MTRLDATWRWPRPPHITTNAHIMASSLTTDLVSPSSWCNTLQQPRLKHPRPVWSPYSPDSTRHLVWGNCTSPCRRFWPRPVCVACHSRPSWQDAISLGHSSSLFRPRHAPSHRRLQPFLPPVCNTSPQFTPDLPLYLLHRRTEIEIQQRQHVGARLAATGTALVIPCSHKGPTRPPLAGCLQVPVC